MVAMRYPQILLTIGSAAYQSAKTGDARSAFLRLLRVVEDTVEGPFHRGPVIADLPEDQRVVITVVTHDCPSLGGHIGSRHGWWRYRFSSTYRLALLNFSSAGGTAAPGVNVPETVDYRVEQYDDGLDES